MICSFRGFVTQSPTRQFSLSSRNGPPVLGEDINTHLLFLVTVSSAAISLSFSKPFCFCVNYHLEVLFLFLFLVVFPFHHFVYPARYYYHCLDSAPGPYHRPSYYASVNFSSMKLSTKPWISPLSGHSSSSRIRRISCTAADVDPRCSSKDELTSNVSSLPFSLPSFPFSPEKADTQARAALITEPATCAARVPAIAALLAGYSAGSSGR